MITNYLRNGDTSLLSIEEVKIAESLIKIDNTFPEQVFLKSLETLNMICETYPNINSMVCGWALKLLRQNYGKLEQKQLCEAPFELYTLAFLPIQEYSSKMIKLVESINKEVTENKQWWFAYKLARLGFRYGHWSDASLPLLEQIQAGVSPN
jgi:hypothetical protein